MEPEGLASLGELRALAVGDLRGVLSGRENELEGTALTTASDVCLQPLARRDGCRST